MIGIIGMESLICHSEQGEESSAFIEFFARSRIARIEDLVL
jgi:hypothetical protein